MESIFDQKIKEIRRVYLEQETDPQTEREQEEISRKEGEVRKKKKELLDKKSKHLDNESEKYSKNV